MAALYHCLNHALFKSLLFLGAGSVLQQTHEHDLERMGGLIFKMPKTALFFLIGCISIAALPPFNGFVSEWLTLQTALQATVLQSGILRTLIPVAAAILALTGALAALCFTKVFGIVFLGRSRCANLENVQDSSFGMRFAMLSLAVLCLVFGIFPTITIAALNNITQSLLGTGLPQHTISNWLWLMPVSNSVASYGAPLVFIGILTAWLLVYLFLVRGNKVVKKIPWDCGFGALAPNMQYTATAFAMPIRRIFKPLLLVHKTISNNQYYLQISDRIWRALYLPCINFIDRVALLVGRIQGGNIRVYLAYVFATLLILLWVIVI